MIPERPRTGLEAGQLLEHDVQLDRAADLGNLLDPLLPRRVGLVAQQLQGRAGVGIGNHLAGLDPLAPFQLDSEAGNDPGHRYSRGDNHPQVTRDVAEDERDHAHSALDISPRSRSSAQPAGLVVEMNRRRAPVVGAGVGADHALAEVGQLQALVLEVILDTFDHRPLEEQMAGLRVAAELLFDLVERGRLADPDVAFAGGPKRVAQSRLDRAEIAPAIDIDGGEPANLAFTPFVVIPELDAAAVLERDEESDRRGEPRKAIR